jgi:hypothetical protein
MLCHILIVADYNENDQQLIAYQFYTLVPNYLTYIEWNCLLLLCNNRGHNDDWDLFETSRLNKNLLKIHEVKIYVDDPNSCISMYKEMWYLAQNLKLLSLCMTAGCDILFNRGAESQKYILCIKMCYATCFGYNK